MKLSKKTGISLIVLIITIIVVIILAAVVILTLSENNPINSSKEATFREDIYNFKTELEIYKAKISRNGEDVTKLYASKDSDPNITDVISSMSKKYIDKLEVREGKLAYVGKDKTDYLQAKEIGLLPEDELLDDDILTELKPFITEWTVEAGDSITLPVGGTCNFIVDYGDGTGKYSVTSSTDEDKNHTYENAGTYTVIIDGKCNEFNNYNLGVSKKKLTKIIQWGSIGVTRINFGGCTNLKGPIPEPCKNTFVNTTNLNHLFYACSSLNTPIPEKLFFNCPKITAFNMTFSACGDVGPIPEKLFSKCVNVTKFNSVFREGRNITGQIPENLFINNTKATNFNWCFSECSKLTGNITNMFRNNPNVTDFTRCFNCCRNLTGEAPALWNRDNVESFSRCFYECTKLSNYSEIPDDWKK